MHWITRFYIWMLPKCCHRLEFEKEKGPYFLAIAGK